MGSSFGKKKKSGDIYIFEDCTGHPSWVIIAENGV
jgi:hypothetical protein